MASKRQPRKRPWTALRVLWCLLAGLGLLVAVVAVLAAWLASKQKFALSPAWKVLGKWSRRAFA